MHSSAPDDKIKLLHSRRLPYIMKRVFFDTVPLGVLPRIAALVVNDGCIAEDGSLVGYRNQDMLHNLVMMLRRKLTKLQVAKSSVRGIGWCAVTLHHILGKTEIFVRADNLKLLSVLLVWCSVACENLQVVELGLDFVDSAVLRMLGYLCCNVSHVDVCLPESLRITMVTYPRHMLD